MAWDRARLTQAVRGNNEQPPAYMKFGGFIYKPIGPES